MADARGTTTPGRSNAVSNSDIEALAANLRQNESLREETDLAAQLAGNWKNIVYGIVLVAAVSLGIKFMREGRENVRGGISQKFEGAQREFERLFFEAPDGTDHRRGFEDTLRAIGDVDRTSSYAQLAEIYRGAEEMRLGEIAQARTRLQPFTIEMLRKENKITKEGLFTEMALLVKAKVLCSDDSTKAEGKTLLSQLSVDAKVVSGEALLAYVRIFGMDQGLVDNALKAHPALREPLKSELSALGAAV